MFKNKENKKTYFVTGTTAIFSIGCLLQIIPLETFLPILGALLALEGACLRNELNSVSLKK